MAQVNAPYLDLVLSAIGLSLCITATFTHGFLVQENTMWSAFYLKTCDVSASCSIKSYLSNNDWSAQLLMSDVQLESVITIVLGGMGWLILLTNAIGKVSLPSNFVIGAIFLLVAGTSEFAVLARFTFMNASIAAGRGYKDSLTVPYSIVLGALGVAFILFAVVRLLHRFNRPQRTAESYHQTAAETESIVTGNTII